MINADWPSRPLGELFEITAGKMMNAAARGAGSKTPFLRTSNVLWDEIDLTSVDEMVIPAEQLSEKSLRHGDLLVCEGGEIGRAAVWSGERAEMSFQNHLHRLRPIVPDLEPHFYVYFLQSAFTQLGIFEGAGNKTTIPNLSRGRLATLSVPVPPTDEQRAIVSALAHIRGGIAHHYTAERIASALKRATMEAIFTRGLRGETRKESELGPVPESWTLESLGTFHTVLSGGTPSRGNPEYWDDGSIPWVKTTEIDYGLIRSTAECITPLGLASSAAKIMPAGTLLMAMYGQGVTRGKVAMLGIDAACNQACAAINAKADRLCATYLYHYLTYRYEAIRSLAHGGQQQNLSLEIVKSIPLAFPAESTEQSEMVEILDALDRKIDLHRRKRAVLDELFKALLHKLMTGEIRVADLNLDALSPARAEVAVA